MDLVQRLSGLKMHPVTGQLYSRDLWNRKDLYNKKDKNKAQEVDKEEQVWYTGRQLITWKTEYPALCLLPLAFLPLRYKIQILFLTLFFLLTVLTAP